ncbi:DUF3488 domain-containing protein [Ruficoccus amylovorans]|uniref:DUF3488 domain-containing protein n=1 Tax=Ruficoccus amylovorans TaxID=1804625 RepID=A0A842HD03_9BACT|nr:DUF3488 and transglutaminase-like domain-containing protein [Ruficoccus amylovorans]MBC2593424.1 DUF3488 domain-containing protein [Ruficoccus amylovorans]
MNTFTQTDFHRLKWLLGQLLALIAFWAMLDLDFGNQPLLLFFGFLIALTVCAPGLPGRIAPLFWRAMTPALILVVGLDFLLHGQEFLKPLVRMVMLLSVYRCLQYRSRREDLQLVLLCLFILVIAGVLTVSLSFGAQMLLFTPLAMVLLFVVNILESSQATKLTRADWKGFRWGAFLRRLRLSMDYRLIGFAAVLFAGVVTVSSVIFVTIPRFRIDQALPFLQMAGTSMSGFSDIVRYGDVSRLQNDDRIAMRVEVPNANNIPSNPYWRMVVLDEYTEQGFRMSHWVKRKGGEMGEGNLVAADYWGREPEGNEGDWIFYMEGNVSEYLPLLGPFSQMRFQIQKKNKFRTFPRLNIVSLETVNPSRFAYSVSGMNKGDRISATEMEQFELIEHDPVASPRIELDREMPRSGLEYPATTRALPYREEDRAYLEGLVQEITGGEEMDAQTFIAAALKWLHGHYRYSRSLREMYMQEGDPLILWMQQDDRGWCEHFAGAFALLARSAGFPSRLVAGFAGAEWNGYEDYLVVRNRNAHAWVEVYDREGNWLRVDPTPQSGLEAPGGPGMETASVGRFSGWLAWIDSIRMVWYRRVISFDEGDQARLAQNLKGYSERTYGQARSWLREQINAFKSWLTQGWNREKILRIALGVSAVCFLFLAMRFVVLWLRSLMHRRSSRPGMQVFDPQRKRAGKLLARYRPVREHLLAHPPEAEDGTAWEETYQALLAVRFGEQSQRPAAKVTFRQARRLLRRARRQGWC